MLTGTPAYLAPERVTGVPAGPAHTRRCNALRAAGGSPGVMSIRSRLRARRSLDAVTAERLLVGRGVPGDAPAGQQALARALEIISGPGTEAELTGEVAAAAAFVQVVASQVRSRRLAGRALVAVACVIAVGGAAAYGALSGSHKAAPVQFGVPASRHAVPAPRVTGTPEGEPQAHPKAAYQLSHPGIGPGVALHRGGR